jgi:hypothetical protein
MKAAVGSATYDVEPQKERIQMLIGRRLREIREAAARCR